MLIFIIFGALIAVALLVMYFGTGQISVFNMHLAAYAYLFICIGSIMNILTKKEKHTEELLDHIQFLMDKRNKELIQEIMSIKSLLFNLTGGRKNTSEHPNENKIPPIQVE